MVVARFNDGTEIARSTASTNGRKFDGGEVDGKSRFELIFMIVLLES